MSAVVAKPIAKVFKKVFFKDMAFVLKDREVRGALLCFSRQDDSEIVLDDI